MSNWLWLDTINSGHEPRIMFYLYQTHFLWKEKRRGLGTRLALDSPRLDSPQRSCCVSYTRLSLVTLTLIAYRRPHRQATTSYYCTLRSVLVETESRVVNINYFQKAAENWFCHTFVHHREAACVPQHKWCCGMKVITVGSGMSERSRKVVLLWLLITA